MPFLRADEETNVRQWFAELERPVELLVAIGPEETPRAGAGDVDFGAEMVRVCEGLAELREQLRGRLDARPVVLVEDEDLGLRSHTTAQASRLARVLCRR